MKSGSTKIWGPPQYLEVDGESALASDEAGRFLDRWGVTRKPKAPGQHAQLVERRGQALRDQLHRTDTQLRAEGITGIPFGFRLGEAIFAGNALLSIGGATPYNGLLGRTPNMLPQPISDAAADDTDGGLPGGSRHVHRLR